jgi:hypothetical protein
VEKYKQEMKNYEFLRKLSESPAFEKGRFEEIFEEAVKKVLEGGSSKNSSRKLPKINSRYILGNISLIFSVCPFQELMITLI